jgi:hypothetical protein
MENTHAGVTTAILAPHRVQGSRSRAGVSMERGRWRVVGGLLFLALQPAAASQTACVFSGDGPHGYYEVEFVGYGDSAPMVVFSSTARDAPARFTLDPGQYTMRHFDRKAATAQFDYLGSGNTADAPSLTLAAQDGQGRLKIGSIVVNGNFSCGN